MAIGNGTTNTGYDYQKAFAGWIDDVRFYSRQLNDTEILEIYQGN
jgi:hypothetical protein